MNSKLKKISIILAIAGVIGLILLSGLIDGIARKRFRTEANDDMDMTVELELEDGRSVNCAIVTILTVGSKDYIVLLPLDEDGQSSEGEVWFYGYKEDETDPNVEPELFYIDDDEEYEAVADAFDEYLDNEEFELMKDEA